MRGKEELQITKGANPTVSMRLRSSTREFGELSVDSEVRPQRSKSHMNLIACLELCCATDVMDEL